MFEQAFKNIDDVLWREAGCTTELDYTEQTSWLLFLKYLDGLEQDRADEAALELFTIVLHIAFVKSTLLKIKQALFLGLTRDKRKAQVELPGLFC